MGSYLLSAVDYLLFILEVLIIVRIVISWLPVPRDNQLVDLLYKLTEPILAPVRNLLEKSALGKNSMIDFSPVIVFLLIGLIKSVLRIYF